MSGGLFKVRQSDSTLFDKIRNYYAKDTLAHPQPFISERTAFLYATLFTLFYVAPFYLSPTLRTSTITSRDAPAVIRARTRAVGLTCLTCTVVTVYALTVYGKASPREILRSVGIWPFDPLDVVKVLGLVVVLFTCSLYEMIIVDAEWRDWSLSAFKEGIWDSWTGYRNLLIAPMSEEVVFRALAVPLFLLAEMDPNRIVFVTPLVFGLAHVHHLFAFLQARTPPNRRFAPLSIWIQGILISLFQFTYTSLFGFFATFVFLRTGNLFAVVAAHSFCNKMGVPRLSGRVGQYESQRPLTSTTPDVAQVKRNDDVSTSPMNVENSLAQSDDSDERKETFDSLQQSPNLGIGWTVVYYALIFVGAYGFYKLLFPLTESGNALAAF